MARFGNFLMVLYCRIFSFVALTIKAAKFCGEATKTHTSVGCIQNVCLGNFMENILLKNGEGQGSLKVSWFVRRWMRMVEGGCQLSGMFPAVEFVISDVCELRILLA